MSRLLKTALAGLSLCAAASAGTLHVDASLTTGLNDGSSWANAFQGDLGVQAALAAAVSGDDVFVAQGSYRPTNTGARGTSFSLKNGVTLYGGFLGGEVSPAERPAFGSAPSILSADLNGDDGSGSLGDNSFHVIRTAGTNATAVLDGFDVVGGNASGGGTNNDRGGGILCLGAVSPTVRNVRFMNNRSSFGGAAGYCNNGAFPTFEDCSFLDGVGGSFGGAFDIANGGPVRYERCYFEGNTAVRAGALEVFATSGVIVSNCVFRDNTATGSSGGGAIWVGSGGNTKFSNCSIIGNSATNNAAGGIRNQGANNTIVANCILYDNSGGAGAQGSANQVSPGTNVTYSIVEGGYTGTGNLAGDPMFVDVVGGDYALTLASPAIDAGDNGSVVPGVTLDFVHNPRQSDEPSVPDTGSGSAPLVDIGAHEFAKPAFTTLPGCFGNPVVLSATSPSLALGQPLGLDAASVAFPTGLTLFYLGAEATDLSGCGVALPGIGELMLSVVGGPTFLGAKPMVAGTSSFGATFPNLPALVGVTFGFQAANVGTLAPGTPIELSNLLTATVAP